MRTFVRMRHLLSTHEEPAQRLDELERQQLNHEERIDGHEHKIAAVFATMEQLLAPPAEEEIPQRRIGFPIGAAMSSA